MRRCAAFGSTSDDGPPRLGGYTRREFDGCGFGLGGASSLSDDRPPRLGGYIRRVFDGGGFGLGGASSLSDDVSMGRNLLGRPGGGFEDPRYPPQS